MWRRVKEVLPTLKKLVRVTDGKRVSYSAWSGNDWEGTCPFIESKDICSWNDAEEAPIIWWTPEEKTPPLSIPILAQVKDNITSNFKRLSLKEYDDIESIVQWTYMRDCFNNAY